MRKILSAGLPLFVGAVIGAIGIAKEMNKVVCKKQEEKEKFRIMYQMMERWMRALQRGHNLGDYFDAHGYKEIAIYGMGDIGKILLQELKGSTVKVKYGIDRNPAANSDVRVVVPEEAVEEVDAVIVTAIAYFNEICGVLSQKFSCPIVSLEDIVHEMG